MIPPNRLPTNRIDVIRFVTIIVLAVYACGSNLAGQLVANDLFVVTEVYQGEQPEPVEIHEIAMVEGVFYDFPSKDDQPWTLFDLPQSRVVLLDRKRKQRTSISTEDLIRITAQADAAVTDPDMRRRFGMDGVVEQGSAGELHLTYDQTRYQVHAATPERSEWALQYGQFVDWACRLNIARPRGVPPFARMRLNEAMTRQGVYPQRIEVEMGRKIGVDPTPVIVRLSSRTTLSSTINPETRKRIQEAHSMRVLFAEIPWDEYEY
ncbi:hypothetical protein [Neorhodopirellula pilleata]|nr:hypothetical protein [Neorhodopirellula pilleata]